MEKTFLGVNKYLTIIILSLLSMFFTFFGNQYVAKNIVSFLLAIIKLLIFALTPLLFYIFEKKNDDVRKIAKIYTSYFIISLVTGAISLIIPFVFRFLFDLINLTILLSSILIIIEQFLFYNDIHYKMYEGIMKIVYLLGNFISLPFSNFINKKSGK